MREPNVSPAAARADGTAPPPRRHRFEALSDAAVAWVGFSARRAWWVLAAALALTAVAGGYTAGRLGIQTDTSAMLSPDLPFQRDARALNAAFPAVADNIVVVVEAALPDLADDAARRLAARLAGEKRIVSSLFAPESEPFFRKNGLLFLDDKDLGRLEQRLIDAQPLLAELARDATLHGLFSLLGTAADEIAGGTAPAKGFTDALARIAASAASVAAGSPRPLSWVDLMEGKDAKGNALRRFILVKPVLDDGALQPAARAMAGIRAAAEALGLTPANGVTVKLTGEAAMESEELASVVDGATRAGAISFVLVGLILLVGLGSLRLVLAVLATLAIGLVWTAGFSTLAIGHLNLMSVAFAVLFIGLGVDFGIHFGLRYREEAAKGLAKDAALAAAAAGVAGPLMLCAAAAAAGFYAFVPTAYSGLSELGIIAGTSMFIALFTSLTVLPALLALLPMRAPRRIAPPRPGIEAAIRRHAGAVVLVALALGIGATALVPMARFDADPIDLRDPTTESVKTFRALLKDSDSSPYTAQVLAPSLSVADGLAGRLEAEKPVAHAVTLQSFVPEGQPAKLEVIDELRLFLLPILSAPTPPAAASGPAALRRAAEGLRGKLGRLAGAEVAAPLAAAARTLDGALARIGDDPAALARLEHALLRFWPGRVASLKAALGAGPVTLADLPASIRGRYVAPDGRARIEVFPAEDLNSPAALARFVDAVRAVAPHATDSPIEILESGRVVSGAVRQASATALALVVVLLLALLGRVRDTALVVLPLVLAGALTVGTQVLIGLPFNYANVIVLPLLLGLGVASGIHLVMRAGEEPAGAALTETSTPRAVILSALTTIGSFGSLAVSSHRGMASMGELLTIAIAFTLVSTLVVLPALMAWLDGRRRARP